MSAVRRRSLVQASDSHSFDAVLEPKAEPGQADSRSGRWPEHAAYAASATVLRMVTNWSSESRTWRRPGASGTLYSGDALDFLKSLRPESADLIFLDPPFNLGRTTRRTSRSLTHNDPAGKVYTFTIWAYSGSIGRWKRDVRNEGAVHAFYGFQEEQIVTAPSPSAIPIGARGLVFSSPFMVKCGEALA